MVISVNTYYNILFDQETFIRSQSTNCKKERKRNKPEHSEPLTDDINLLIDINSSYLLTQWYCLHNIAKKHKFI